MAPTAMSGSGCPKEPHGIAIDGGFLYCGAHKQKMKREGPDPGLFRI